MASMDLSSRILRMSLKCLRRLLPARFHALHETGHARLVDIRNGHQLHVGQGRPFPQVAVSAAPAADNCDAHSVVGTRKHALSSSRRRRPRPSGNIFDPCVSLRTGHTPPRLGSNLSLEGGAMGAKVTLVNPPATLARTRHHRLRLAAMRAACHPAPKMRLPLLPRLPYRFHRQRRLPQVVGGLFGGLPGLAQRIAFEYRALQLARAAARNVPVPAKALLPRTVAPGSGPAALPGFPPPVCAWIPVQFQLLGVPYQDAGPVSGSPARCVVPGRACCRPHPDCSGSDHIANLQPVTGISFSPSMLIISGERLMVMLLMAMLRNTGVRSETGSSGLACSNW